MATQRTGAREGDYLPPPPPPPQTQQRPIKRHLQPLKRVNRVRPMDAKSDQKGEASKGSEESTKHQQSQEGSIPEKHSRDKRVSQ